MIATSDRTTAENRHERRKVATRLDIVLAGRRLLSSEGLYESRIEDITTLAGIAKGTLYLHFRSKEDLAVAVVSSGFAELRAYVDGRLRDLDDSEAVAAGILAAHVDFFAQNPDLMRIFHQVRGALTFNRPRWRPLRTCLLEHIEFLAGGLARGEARSWPAQQRRDLAMFLFGVRIRYVFGLRVGQPRRTPALCGPRVERRAGARRSRRRAGRRAPLAHGPAGSRQAEVGLVMSSAFDGWMLPLVVLAVSAAAGYLMRHLVIGWLARLSARTATDLDDLVVGSIRGYVPAWFVSGGVVLAARLSPLGDRAVGLVARGAGALFVVSLSLAAADLVGRLVDRTVRRTQGTFVSTSLTRNILRAAVLAVGLLLVLGNLGVDITPLLTALGVGSLAVALALQPTLSNLFAGLHITLSRPVRPGDFVELEGGSQGFVTDIGWRATRVRELSNNIIVVPNARLAEMTVKNYSLPEPEQSVVIQVGVSYGSDLQRVERITCEVARDVLRDTPGAMHGFEPFIRYHTLGDSAIGFSVILRVGQFTDRYLVTHEFLKRLKDRYDREQIEIPFPQRVLRGTLDVRGEAGAAWRGSLAAEPERKAS